MTNLKFASWLIIFYVLFCRLSTAQLINNTDVRPENFSHTATINVVDSNAMAVAVRLPPWSYLATKNQLRDLRVFNAEGIVVEHELIPLKQAGERHEFNVNAVAIPVDKNAEEVLGHSADINVDSKGNVNIHLREQSTAPKTEQHAKVNQWILDDAKLTDLNVTNFRFELNNAQTVNFEAELSIETSGDLRSWYSVIMPQKILNYGKQHLAQLIITIPTTHARYWRIRSDSVDLSQIAKVYASVDPQMEEVKESLTVDCQMNPAKDSLICPFKGAKLPVNGFQFDFGQEHVAFNARIRTYAENPSFTEANSKNQPLQEKYEMMTNPQSTILPLGGFAISGVVVTAQSGGKLSLQNAPKLTLFWPAQQLKFMVNGNAPFTLAVGATALPDNAMHFIDTPGTPSSAVISEAVVKSPEKLSLAHKARPWLLWALLGFAVMALAGMALSLLKQK